MGKQTQAQIERMATAQADVPARFVENSADMSSELKATLDNYRRATRNASRENAPLTYLAGQKSFVERIFNAVKAEGMTTIFVKSDVEGGFAKIPTSRASFAADYLGKIVPALHAAVKNGVAVCNAEKTTTKKGDYVKITAVGGIVGVD